jgi:hypothetical protein
MPERAMGAPTPRFAGSTLYCLALVGLVNPVTAVVLPPMLLCAWHRKRS